MSALLVDDLYVPLSTRPVVAGWRHVEADELPSPRLAAVPQQARVGTSTQAAPLRLTDRGIAVIVVFFIALFATAAVVLVTSFLSVSNDPIPARADAPALVAGQV